MLLILGYALLALALILVCVDATSMYIAQKRLDSVADSAVLAGAEGFTLSADLGGPTARLTDAGVRAQADAVVAALAPTARVVSADTPDGRSARVEVTDVWRPPVLSLFVPDGVALAARAVSRTAFVP